MRTYRDAQEIVRRQLQRRVNELSALITIARPKSRKVERLRERVAELQAVQALLWNGGDDPEAYSV